MWSSFDIDGELLDWLAAQTWPQPTPPPEPEPVPTPPPPPVTGETIRLLLPDGMIAIMPIEEYLRGVVAQEMPATWPAEALKAQAVAARSYATHLKRFPKHASRGADICTEPECQAWRPGKINPTSDAAVSATAGIVMRHNGNVTNALYSANCGGATINFEQGFRGNPVAYLKGVPCPDKGTKNGHGVGLCQHGARVMAEGGASHYDILHHYYTDVEVEGEPTMDLLAETLQTAFGAAFHDVRKTLPANGKFNRADSHVMPYIAIHHTTGPRTVSAEGIARYHTGTNGWAGIGYHFLIRMGELWYVGDVDTARAHVLGRNHEALGVAVTGDYSNQPMELEDWEALRLLIRTLDNFYVFPKELRGHRELTPPQHTTCPARLMDAIPTLREPLAPDYGQVADKARWHGEQAVREIEANNPAAARVRLLNETLPRLAEIEAYLKGVA